VHQVWALGLANAALDFGMPLYFFHFRGGGEVAIDPEGQELPDLAAAREEAIGGLRDRAADRLRSGEPVDSSDRMEITNGAGELLLTVPFGDAVTILPKGLISN
jgi:hypothetical protein